MPARYANYISTTLAGNITSLQTSIVVTSSAGMPAAGNGYYFYATLIDAPSALANRNPPVQREVVLVESLAVNTLQVVRAQDGTAAFAWPIGTVLELRFNAAAATELARKTGLNVVDFLAAGNGVTNDTTAITRAMTAAAALNTGVYFPAGTYVTDPIAVPANLAFIRGDGPTASIIYPQRQAYAAATPMINLSTNAKRCAVSNLGLDMQNVVFVGTRGFQLGGDGVSLTNVDIIGRATFGVISQAGTGARINGMRITAVGGSIDTGVFSQSPASETQVEGVVIVGNHNYGILLGGGVFNSIRSCSAYAMAATGSEVFSFALSLCSLSSISDCYSLDSRREAVNLTDCLSCTISDCNLEWTGVNGIDFAISINGTQAGGGSRYNTVAGNVMRNSYTSAIVVAGHSSYNTISDNNAYDCAYRVGAGGSMLACFTSAAGDVNTANRFSDNNANTVTGAPTYGALESQAGGSTCTGNLWDRNVLNGCTTRYSFAVSGSKIVDHEWQTWAPTVTNSAGGGFTSTVQAARYQINGKGVNFVLRVTVTNAGAGGFVSATLPPGFTPVANGGSCAGLEVTVTGSAVVGQITAAGINQMRLYNTNPTAVLNYSIVVSGYYEVA